MLPTDEERRLAQISRRVLGLALLMLSVLVVAAVLRGIISTLLALPGGAPSHTTGAGPEFDSTNLEPCAEALQGLEKQFRAVVAQNFGAPTSDPAPEWVDIVRPLEESRRRVIGECQLDETPTQPAGPALARATSELEEAFGALGLLWERYRADGRIRLRAVENALEEARRTLGSDRDSTAPRTIRSERPE